MAPKPKNPAPAQPTEKTWPKVGLAMPTVDNAEQACQAMEAFFRSYPGDVVFAVVANGTGKPDLKALREFAGKHPGKVLLDERTENIGYGQGCNAGLGALCERGDIEVYGVTNDDVLPASTCLTELVGALQELDEMGLRPGLVAPVTNNISGGQQRHIGDYSSPEQMEARATEWFAKHHEAATQAIQLRGLFLLIHPELLGIVGGFDPRFGVGNFEDDDFNLRARLAGFSLWIAEGAFLHHHGSTTFRKLNIDYKANIERNAEAFLRKWRLNKLDEWPGMLTAPDGVELYCPLSGEASDSTFRIRLNGEWIDLIEQASDVEFAGWVASKLSQQPRTARKVVATIVRELEAAA